MLSMSSTAHSPIPTHQLEDNRIDKIIDSPQKLSLRLNPNAVVEQMRKSSSLILPGSTPIPRSAIGDRTTSQSLPGADKDAFRQASKQITSESRLSNVKIYDEPTSRFRGFGFAPKLCPGSLAYSGR
jgi:hypothetical protein